MPFIIFKQTDMTENELNLLQSELRNARYYLEFGSGNSTMLAASLHNIHRMDIVESDDSFFREKVYPVSSVKEALDSGKLVYHYIDVGETGEWGYPVTTDRMEFWPEYHRKAFRTKTNYDLVLIDGRFRIACILQTCLRCSNKTHILVHDFFNRPHYFVVLPFLNLIKQVDTFGLFKIDARKIKRYRSLIKGYIELYQYRPGF